VRYVGPQTTVSFTAMLNIPLMCVIGGLGTTYGAIVGAAIFIVAENYIQVRLQAVSQAMTALPLLAQLFHPDRWLLWFGTIFVLSVYFFRPGWSESFASKGCNWEVDDA
jgi:branched-chain amino acid transport system permease protein